MAWRSGSVFTTSTTTEHVVSWQNSTGLVAQSNVALKNTLFLTGGVRFEHDSRLAGVDQIETLPMIGASIVGEHGPISVKFRTAYGEGIRPPTTPSRLQFWETHDVRSRLSGVRSVLLNGRREPNPGIDRDGAARALALQVTHFNQRASGLIRAGRHRRRTPTVTRAI